MNEAGKRVMKGAATCVGLYWSAKMLFRPYTVVRFVTHSDYSYTTGYYHDWHTPVARGSISREIAGKEAYRDGGRELKRIEVLTYHSRFGMVFGRPADWCITEAPNLPPEAYM